MNRKILLQVAGPAVVIGMLLLGSSLVGAWYISRLQATLAGVLSRNVASLRAAQELEIRVRQLRFHCFLYLVDRTPARLSRIQDDHRHVEEALAEARRSAAEPEERACVAEIEYGYRQYHDELDRLLREVPPGAAANWTKLADAHPVQHVVEPCQRLLAINQQKMADSSAESDRVSRQARVAMILLGLAGPAGGLIAGFGIARGLSRSIFQMSVRIQDIAQRLDQDVASVSIAADGDMQELDNQLRYVVGRVEEVAERLQRHQRDMLRAEQLSAVGQLAASVAHEVRNPLTAVKMLVEVALRNDNRKPLTVEDLRVIHREVERLERTVQNFLNFARLPTPRRSPRDLRDVVHQAVELVQARARQQGVEVQVRAPQVPVPADVDGDQVGKVLVNLFLNALDVMPGGGRLEVDVDSVPPAGVRLEVTDTGPGIPAEVADRLFTPFTSTKPTGTGLGLSISRRIIEEHGGRITANNRAAGGAGFTITLPAGRSPASTANGRGQAAQATADSGADDAHLAGH
jgi:signal transduction histidine kinase